MVHSGAINQTSSSYVNEQKGNSFQGNRRVNISRLINSVYFSIGTCFIMNMPEEYRLIAIHKKTILFDKNYRTLRGARIAFSKQFKNLAWTDDVVAEWSHFYPPNRDWIDEMLSIAKNAECN